MLRIFGWTSVLSTATFAASALFGQAQEFDTLTVNVPATSNPYLAGMPNGTAARVGDSAPQQSPILVEHTLSHAVAVTFTALGATEHTPYCPPDCYGPNGTGLTRHHNGAEHGIADVIAPIDALMGVFLTDEQPDQSKTPRLLNFGASRRTSSNLSPALKQLFFIGDGRTISGAPRRYLVPKRATKLYLGVMDGYEWNNNSGSFTVTVAIERDQVDTGMYTTDSSITFAKWAAGPAFLAPDKSAGALIAKIIQGRIYFSVNHRAGAPFRDHEGYFEFDVSTR